MPYCFQSWGYVNHSFNSTEIWIYFFRLFVCFDFHWNKISLFSITPCQVFLNVISTSCDFCMKTVRHFFFLYLMLHKLLLQKFRYATMHLLCVLFYDGREHTQQFKYVRFLFVFINKGKSMALLD